VNEKKHKPQNLAFEHEREHGLGRGRGHTHTHKRAEKSYNNKHT